ncbi:hypothetical protein GKZ68_03540 [Hymenobacter sp. BRD128]|uniref:hypothetical protein n=1 Tax=Hymenobacter sp. BRD128 TaxID=2675878 RepID=UPI0015674C41|nr:hypothetical protein [Hymenobacter sp. BRD128]QKG55794.1 hypothetical protein GKZ68_03540 [Hymenobacter sp. BRD128]
MPTNEQPATEVNQPPDPTQPGADQAPVTTKAATAVAAKYDPFAGSYDGSTDDRPTNANAKNAGLASDTKPG